MTYSSVTVLGLMSGTSLDGLDLACTRFTRDEQGRWRYALVAVDQVGYSQDWEQKLRDAVHWPAVELLELDVAYGRWLGEQVNAFTEKHQVEIDLVASHGHTIHHRPEKGLTVQIGHGRALADTCGRTVVCDFRTRDVLLSGQGAPLVPIGDELLFSNYEYCLNLGGFANVSYRRDGHRYAYDLGLANMVLNDLVRQTGKPFDEDGAMAREGKLIPELLNQLDALPFYQQPAPKSTGYEWYLASVKPLFEQSDASIPDQLHTAVHHLTGVIARDINELSGGHPGTMLVTGGGALNSFLMETLDTKLTDHLSLAIPEADLIHYKEAIVFGLMGVLRLRSEPNCLASVTGAQRSVSGGEVYQV